MDEFANDLLAPSKEHVIEASKSKKLFLKAPPFAAVHGVAFPLLAFVVVLAAVLYRFPADADLGGVLAVLGINIGLVSLSFRMRGHHRRLLPSPPRLSVPAPALLFEFLCFAVSCSYLLLLPVPAGSGTAAAPAPSVAREAVGFLLPLIDRLRESVPRGNDCAWGSLAAFVSLALFFLVCRTQQLSRAGRARDQPWAGIPAASHGPHGIHNELVCNRLLFLLLTISCSVLMFTLPANEPSTSLSLLLIWGASAVTVASASGGLYWMFVSGFLYQQARPPPVPSMALASEV